MKSLQRILFALTFALVGSLAQAQVFKHPTLLKIKLTQDGETLASPALMLEQRIPAVLDIEGVVRIEIATVSNNDAADMSFKIFALRDGAFVPLATPRLLGLFDQEAAIEFGSDAVKKIKISVVPSKGERIETPRYAEQ